MDQHKHDYMFPRLFNMQVQNVAKRLTNVLRDNMNVSSLTREEGEKRKAEFTSRSMRKGTMTENRVHPDLNMAEEYTRSGHSRNSANVNIDAEGYIEQTPPSTHLGACPLQATETATSFLPSTVSRPSAMHKARLIACSTISSSMTFLF